MATTDLSSKSLGDILLQSGIGSPDHTAPKGSLYTDKSAGALYQNKNGSTTWEILNTVAYAEAYYQSNTNATTVTGTGPTSWFSVGNTFTFGDSVGFSGSTNTLTLLSGYDGDYEISMHATLAYVAGTEAFELGVSKNGTAPEVGSYNSHTLDVTYNRATVSSRYLTTLTGGTALTLAVRRLTGTANNVIVRNAQLTARKVK